MEHSELELENWPVRQLEINMSFDVLREHPAPKAQGLRSDWSREEQRFRAGLQNFWADIEVANHQIHNPQYAYSVEEKVGAEVVEVKEVPNIVQNSAKKLQDDAARPVESNNVAGTNSVPPTIRPSQPKEPVLTIPAIDPFDSIIESNSPKNYSKTSEDDFFQTKAAIQPAKETKPAVATDPFDTSDVPAKPASNDAMDGFDTARFNQMMATINRMLAGLPNVDLDKILNSLGEFSVCLDLDHLRENPSVLTDKLLEIQAKRDTLHAQTLQLTPLHHSMKHAADYFESVGVNCSVASSKEKRLAQLKFYEPNFWIRLSNVNRTKATVDQTFLHLEGQYECISRLITGYQIKNKIGEISRGDIPFDPPYKPAMHLSQPQPQVIPKPAPVTGTPPKTDAPDDLLTRSLSQPAAGQTKFENLETFKAGPKKNAVQNFAPGEQEW